jgi:caa(3)-type oxidase subunit IV
MSDSAHGAEEIKKHVKTYIYVGAALLVFTGITVLVSTMHLPRAAAIYVGVCIACVKGFLVAGYFMHLFDEKKIIYRTLVITAVLFVPLLFFPWFTIWGSAGHEGTALTAPAVAAHATHHAE